MGVRAEDIINVAENLVADGQPVTSRAVRNRLGSGSYSTILKVLRPWRAQRERAISQQTHLLDDLDAHRRALRLAATREARLRAEIEALRVGLPAGVVQQRGLSDSSQPA